MKDFTNDDLLELANLAISQAKGGIDVLHDHLLDQDPEPSVYYDDAFISLSRVYRDAIILQRWILHYIEKDEEDKDDFSIKRSVEELNSSLQYHGQQYDTMFIGHEDCVSENTDANRLVELLNRVESSD